METLDVVRQNVKAYHKNLTMEFINDLSPVSLLRWCHPSDRQTYATTLVKEKVITKEEGKEFAKFV